MKQKNILQHIIGTVALMLTFSLTGFSGFFGINYTLAAEGKLRVNNIYINNFINDDNLQDDILNVYEASGHSIAYSIEDEVFQLVVTEFPFDESRLTAETSFIEQIGITRNEACFLDVRVINGVKEEIDEVMYHPLSFCKNEILADVNEDGAVNGFDFSICLNQQEEMFEGELAAQEVSGLPEIQTCDFDVNRKIDALDFSIVLSSIGSLTAEEPVDGL